MNTADASGTISPEQKAHTTKHLLITLTLDERTRMMIDDGELVESLANVIESFTGTWSQGPLPAVQVQPLNQLQIADFKLQKA